MFWTSLYFVSLLAYPFSIQYLIIPISDNFWSSASDAFCFSSIMIIPCFLLCFVISDNGSLFVGICWGLCWRCISLGNVSKLFKQESSKLEWGAIFFFLLCVFLHIHGLLLMQHIAIQTQIDIQIVFLMHKLSQIWPENSLQVGFCVLLMCPHHSLSTL